MRYPFEMDHLTALKRKVEDLRAEIAQIRMVNQQERALGETSAQASYLQRLARLEEIKEELARLLAAGRPSSEADDGESTGGPFLVKRAS
jgi:hypothetical protein